MARRPGLSSAPRTAITAPCSGGCASPPSRSVRVAAAAGSAEAKVFRGKSDKDRPAAVIIGIDGLLRTARVHWRARCI